MEVRFKVPDVIWAEILENAEERGATVAHLMSAAALTLVHRDSGRYVRAAARRKRVVDLVRAGYVDKDVAAMTGELLQYVQNNRRREGLPANRKTERAAA